MSHRFWFEDFKILISQISELKIYLKDFVHALLLEDLPNILFSITTEDLFEFKISRFSILKILPKIFSKILKISEHLQDFPVEDSPQIFQDFTNIFKIPD